MDNENKLSVKDSYPLKVCITGGIGSGKTVVCEFFKTLGIKVYNADEEAKKFLYDNIVKTKIRQYFGKEVFDKNDKIKTKVLADIVFNDNAGLEKLNSIIHPLVKQDFSIWSDKYCNEPYILLEAAILFEIGFHKDFYNVITVTAPEELRIKRIMKRDKITKEQVIERMQNQWKDNRKIEMADFVIYNDEKHLLIPQVLAIHRILISKQL